MSPEIGSVSQGFQFANNFTLARPSGTTQGDVLYAFLHSRNNRTVTGVPDGWTLLEGPSTFGLSRVWLYRKVAGSSEPVNYQWTLDNAQHNVGILLRVTGVDTDTPEHILNSINGVTGVNSLAIDALTPTIDDTLLLALYAVRNDNDQAGQSWTHPSGMTSAASVTGEFVTASGVAYLSSPPINTSTGSKTVTYANESGGYQGLLLALTPGDSTPGPTPPDRQVYIWNGSSWALSPRPSVRIGGQWVEIPSVDGPSNEIAPNNFATIAPGGELRDGSLAASLVGANTWEPRSANNTANNTVPQNLGNISHGWSGYTTQSLNELLARVDGDFTGTTDQIIQWAALKYGLEIDLVRALCVQESNWLQSAEGDHESDPGLCVPGDGRNPCPTSFGITQIKHFMNEGTWPHSVESTAFNLDYACAKIRANYEGWSYEGSQTTGDLWGAIGMHFSGTYGSGYATYVASVQGYYNSKPWLSWPEG
jgi:hypothetical protein